MKKRGLLVLAALWLMGSIGLAQGADAKAEQILKQARAPLD
ncbi:MAG: hypothetical protein ACK496_04470 [Acidobacteriota bacterium]